MMWDPSDAADAAALFDASESRGRDRSTPPRLEPLVSHAGSNASRLLLAAVPVFKSVTSPLFLPGDETADRRLLVSEAADYAPQCDVFKDDGVPFPDTPETNAIGRVGFSRKTALLKLAVMHKYGSRCMLTLMALCLQLAHVIPVSADSKFIRFLEWVLGDQFGTFNIHSTRNLWLVDADIHYALDRGLIKLVPEMAVLDAILEFSEQVRKKHEGKQNNDDIGLDRNKAFPPGNYTYWIVGILCSPEYVIHRHHLIASDPPNAMNTGREVVHADGGFSYEDVGELREPSTEMLDHGPPSNETDGLKLPHVHLKGYRLDKKKVDVLDPLEASPALKIRLPQDPLLVTANVGNFLWTLQNKVNWDRKTAAKGGTFVPWTVADLVDDPTFATLLSRVLKIYQKWHEDTVPPKGKSGNTAKTNSQKGKLRSHASTSDRGDNQNAAGPSTALQPPAPLRRSSRHMRSNTDSTSDASSNAAGPSGTRLAPHPTLPRRSSRVTQSEVEAEAAAAAAMPPPPVPTSRPSGAKRRQGSGSQAVEPRKSHRKSRADNASTSTRSERG